MSINEIKNNKKRGGGLRYYASREMDSFSSSVIARYPTQS